MRQDVRANFDPPGVNLYSPVGIVSGLGTAARGYLAAIRAANIPVSVIPLREMFVHHQSVGNAEPQQSPRHPVAVVLATPDATARFLHFHARGFSRARYKIGIWIWELPALRDEWWNEFQVFDEIWVPTIFCQRAVRAMTTKPVVLIPLVVFPPKESPTTRREAFGIGAEEFVFLYMFDASSFVARKNPHCLVDAFEAAFPGDQRVRLVLKVSNATVDPALSDYLNALTQREQRVSVLRQTMSTHEVEALIGACDCYVSPHRTEGFGLTVAEAMAQGVPVIATDYGGTADFVSEAVGFPLRYRLTELEQDQGPYMKGAIWADPSRTHLRDLMRHVAANPGEAGARGQAARALILGEYSAEAVGRRIARRLTEIALT